jgi:hypothetical protein
VATLTRTRRRPRQRQRLGTLAAGSKQAVEIVRGYIAAEQRREQQGDEWKATLRARETYTRKRFV